MLKAALNFPKTSVQFPPLKPPMAPINSPKFPITSVPTSIPNSWKAFRSLPIESELYVKIYNFSINSHKWQPPTNLNNLFMSSKRPIKCL
jgi:hypothetical protein